IDNLRILAAPRLKAAHLLVVRNSPGAASRMNCWFEVISECDNEMYMSTRGRPKRAQDRARQHFLRVDDSLLHAHRDLTSGSPSEPGNSSYRRSNGFRSRT